MLAVVGVDFTYVRCAESLIALAGKDRHLAELLMSGGGGAVESIDIGRSENALYRLLGPPGADLLNFSDPHSDWAGLALSGDGWLHPGIDTGYGTPRFLLAAVVRSIAREFEALTEAVFLDRFEDVIRDADRLRGYLLPNYACLRRFYLDAAREEQAVIVTPL